jgi:filamentous hemagglutinin family protein
MMNKTIHLWFASAIALCCVSTTSSSQAQIVPDTTVNTSVTPQGNTSIITGGTVAQTNLFHSFEQFSVPTGTTAYFNNAPEIQTIMTRVTGSSISNIDGLIQANGTAALFLLNPNGIIFGPNASLNIGGSFLATTASSLNFVDGTQFSATVPQTTPLLAISVPIGLQFGGTTGSILNQSQATDSRGEIVGLQVQPGKTLALLGGGVRSDGGILQAPGGRIELGGVTGAGMIGLNSDGNSLRLSFPDAVTLADVSLTNGTQVNVRAGGSITINAQNLNMAGGSQLQAGIDSLLGSPDTKAGDIEIKATGAINLTNNSSISNGVLAGGVGKGGDINITTGSLFGTNGARVTTNASGQGDAGSVTIAASDTVSFDGVSSNGLSSGVFSIVERERTGQGGDIRVTTGSLLLTNGAVVSAETFARGNGGSIRITASDTLSFDGVGSNGASSGLLSGTRTPAIGNGGDITVTTGVLRIANGAVLSARTWNRYSGGNIIVDANNLALSGGGQLLTTAYSSGSAGNITVNAAKGITISGSDPTFYDRLAQLVDPSRLDQANAASGVFSDTIQIPVPGLDATGDGGNIRITTQQLIIRNGGKLAVSTEGSGDAGDIRVQANSIHLDTGARLDAETRSQKPNSPEGQGNIILLSQDLVLRNGSNITTNATGSATGGNITIDTEILAALENSNISANAQDSFGGRVIINAQGIFGTQFRLEETPESDITATSALGPQFSGTVQINTPDVDPNQGLARLPEAPVSQEQITQGCPADKENTFIVTGRGGLPPQPTEPLTSDAVWVDLDRPIQSYVNRSGSAVAVNPSSSEPLPLVEAQGWVINGKGEVILVAQAPTVTPSSSPLTLVTCHAS